MLKIYLVRFADYVSRLLGLSPTKRDINLGAHYFQNKFKLSELACWGNLDPHTHPPNQDVLDFLITTI